MRIKIPHPIQYQGSKRNLAHLILKYFPKNIDRLIEPFAGTGAISVACASKAIAKKYWLNELNEPLLQLMKIIIENPEKISDYYENLWNKQHNDSIEHYYSVREEFNRSKNPKLFLYLLSRGVKGAVRYNNEGYFNQSPDKRRKGAKPENMKKNIFGVSFLLKGKTNFTSLDYKRLIPKIKESDLLYMDPPYQGVCGDKDSRYYSGINHSEFVEFIEQLNSKKIRYLISYDGKCGNRTYGQSLPKKLNLHQIELNAGRSSQATLLGKKDITYESLYISNSLVEEINFNDIIHKTYVFKQESTLNI